MSSRCASRSTTRRPYATPPSSPPISRPSPSRSRPTAAAILARGRLRALRRAVDVFGFHLAPLDLRQNSDVHERTVAELFAAATPGPEYLLLERGGARRAAARRAALAAPAGVAVHQLQRGDRGRAGDLPRRRGDPREPMAPAAIRTSIISKTQGVSDMLELALLLKEVGLVTAERPRRRQHRSAVRDHRGPARLRRRDGPAARRCRNTAGSSTASAASRK